MNESNKKTIFKSGHLSGVSIHGVIFNRVTQNSFTLLYSMTSAITSIQSITPHLSIPKMSHAQSGGATHTRVMSITIMWLIFGTVRCGEIDRIDLTADVNVKVSRVKEFSATLLKITLCALARLKEVRFKNNFFRFIYRILFIKKLK
jgi:hypothetical protein